MTELLDLTSRKADSHRCQGYRKEYKLGELLGPVQIKDYAGREPDSHSKSKKLYLVVCRNCGAEHTWNSSKIAAAVKAGKTRCPTCQPRTPVRGPYEISAKLLTWYQDLPPPPERGLLPPWLLERGARWF